MRGFVIFLPPNPTLPEGHSHQRLVLQQIFSALGSTVSVRSMMVHVSQIVILLALRDTMAAYFLSLQLRLTESKETLLLSASRPSRGIKAPDRPQNTQVDKRSETFEPRWRLV